MPKIVISLLLCSMCSFLPASGMAVGVRNDSSNIHVNGVNLRLEIITPAIVRITLSAGNGFFDRDTLSIVPQHVTAKWKRNVSPGMITFATDSLIIKVDRKNGAVSFFNVRKRLLLRADPVGAANFVESRLGGSPVQNVRQDFTLSRSEGIYGLGQFEDPIMNYRGHDILLAQANRTIINPFLVSTNGYGLLWNNYSESRFHDGTDGTYFWSQVADQIDYYFVYGPTVDKVIDGYRRLTGVAPMYGKWAYGYWQSKERYTTSTELINVVKEYRERGIPLDNIVQDWQYWGGMDKFSGMVWDSTRYPDPVKMIDSLHDMHAHLMATIWPAFGKGSEIYHEMEKDNFLFSPTHWCGGKVYDAWNPDARSLYWSFVKKGLFDVGVDAFWMDATEPEFRCTDDRYITALSLENAGRNFLGSNARYLNTYSLEDTRGIYNHQRKATDKKRVFILTRSSFTGQQRFAAAAWSGDTFASWDALRTQVAAGVNFCMSGLPYWTNDIGGFVTSFNYPDGVKDDAYKELYVRWFEFGAFNPIFRSHGTNTPREVWQFGDKGSWAYDALVRFDDLRYRLMPYIYSLAWKVTHDGYTIMRGLPMDFQNDRNTFDIGTQFMFGPSMMVCPVLKPMYHTDSYEGYDITPDHFYSSDGKDHALRLDIFKGTNFDSLVMSRKFDASQISWVGCLPEGLDSSYSVKAEGMIKSERPGEYTFYVITDGGVRLTINKKLLIDKWDDTANTRYEAKIRLNSETKYAFKLEYREFRPGNASLKVNWIPPHADRHPLEVSVYLPVRKAEGKPITWYDFWTGRKFSGGRHIFVKAPIDMIPLYVPSGSIIPMGPVIQYADENPSAPLEIRIYPGKDGTFNLYEDENDSYDYEKGLYSIIPFKWDDKSKTLTVGNRIGNFPGMIRDRVFNVVIVRPGHGGGLEPEPVPEKTVRYDGKKIRLRL